MPTRDDRHRERPPDEASRHRPRGERNEKPPEEPGMTAMGALNAGVTVGKIPSIWALDNDGTLTLDLHPGQAKAWTSEKRFIFVIAGTQGGKTSFGPWWLWREIQRTARSGEQNDYLAVTSSFDLFSIKMLPTMREVFENILGIGRFWSGSGVIEICDLDPDSPTYGQFKANRSSDVMWARIILRSAVSRGGLESATAKSAWLDEAGQDNFTVETWEAVLRRLSLAQGRVLATTTLYNIGWIKTEVFDRFERGDPNFDVIQFASTQNPAFSQAEFERAKGSMQEHRFKMFYMGEFAKPPGMIYSMFDDAVHLVTPFLIPREWPRYMGLDFGAVNTAQIWLAHDIEGTGPKHTPDSYYIYRESLEGDKTTEEHVTDTLHYLRASPGIPSAIQKKAIEQKKPTGTEYLARVWGGAPSESQQRRDWKNEGIQVLQPPVVDVESGIDRVAALFKQRRLFVFVTMRGLRDEIGTYRRVLMPDGTPTEWIEQQRVFHRLDALRYVSCGIVGSAPQKQARSLDGATGKQLTVDPVERQRRILQSLRARR